MFSIRPQAAAAMRSLFPAIVLAVLLAAPAGAVVVGDPGPSITLMDLDGAVHSLSNEAGNVVLLYFLGHNAALCLDAAGQLEQRLHLPYGSKGLRVFGIDCWNGTAEQLGLFRKDSGVSFPLLLGGMNTAEAYDLAYHSVVLLDGRGIVRFISSGPEPTSFDIDSVESEVKELLDNAASIEESTWGTIKTLYGRRLRNP